MLLSFLCPPPFENEERQDPDGAKASSSQTRTDSSSCTGVESTGREGGEVALGIAEGTTVKEEARDAVKAASDVAE